jgi:HSP90 family molecular chaperone
VSTAKKLFPKFLLPMRGVIDSTDIPLNVSRSALQTDRTVRKIADYVSRKVGDRLKELYRDNREEYISVWQDVATFVKFGALNDEKFKNKSKISLSIAPPMRQGSNRATLHLRRQLCRCNPRRETLGKM